MSTLPRSSTLWAHTRLGYLEIPIYRSKSLRACGLTEFDTPRSGSHRITLKDGMDPAVEDDTILHEFIHIIDYVRELGLELDDSGNSLFRSGHSNVQILASDLAQMLRELRQIAG